MALKYAVGQLPAFREVTGLSSEEAEKAVLFTWSKFLESVGPDPAPSVGAGIAQVKDFCRAHPEYLVTWRGTLVYRFNKTEFESLVCKGFDYRAVAMALRGRDVLIYDPGRLQKKMNIPGQGSSLCYVLKGNFVDED